MKLMTDYKSVINITLRELELEQWEQRLQHEQVQHEQVQQQETEEQPESVGICRCQERASSEKYRIIMGLTNCIKIN